MYDLLNRETVMGIVAERPVTYVFGGLCWQTGSYEYYAQLCVYGTVTTTCR